MPQYPWLCKRCGMEVEIIRAFQDYEVPPTEDELMHDVQCDHEWERQIASGTRYVRGDGWGRQKRKD